MSLGGEPPAENCDFIVLLSHVCQVGSRAALHDG
jgi:hypothetical protein